MEEIELKIQELEAVQKAYIYSLRMTFNEFKGDEKTKQILEAKYKDRVAEMKFRILPPDQQRAKIRKWLIGKPRKTRVLGIVETIQAFGRDQIEKYIQDTTNVSLFARWERDENARPRKLGFKVIKTGETIDSYMENATEETATRRRKYRRHVIEQASGLTAQQLNGKVTAKEIYNIKDMILGNQQTGRSIEDGAYSATIDDEIAEIE